MKVKLLSDQIGYLMEGKKTSCDDINGGGIHKPPAASSSVKVKKINKCTNINFYKQYFLIIASFFLSFFFLYYYNFICLSFCLTMNLFIYVCVFVWIGFDFCRWMKRKDHCRRIDLLCFNSSKIEIKFVQFGTHNDIMG